MDKLTLIALDGPSGAGKSTTAKRLAEALGWEYLDTGAMYRATALAMTRAGVTLEDRAGLERLLAGLRLEQRGTRILLNGEDVSAAIRSQEVTKLVSPISADARIREVLVEQQRAIGARGRFVVDGRDIGTVVFPHACCKVFLTATLDARAERRFREMELKGVETTLAEVRADLARRDHADSTRAVSPLRKAEDAWELDNGHLEIHEVVAAVVAHHQQHAP
ncbi:MAG TPA: (d)CMP kinase [Holophagaceae bacterium]|nr:(d)CMP kinase [Holophagaceae bacterium]